MYLINYLSISDLIQTEGRQEDTYSRAIKAKKRLIRFSEINFTHA